eukprot:scaffold344695_cov122-Cyclotella_meneghiniana.AAC.1
MNANTTINQDIWGESGKFSFANKTTGDADAKYLRASRCGGDGTSSSRCGEGENSWENWSADETTLYHDWSRARPSPLQSKGDEAVMICKHNITDNRSIN